MKQVQTTYKTIGLCLSGGGARGLAHVGVLKALLEHNIKPTHISGTSMGAIIGVLYASGYDISQMLEISHHLGWKQILPDWTDFWKEKKKTFLSTKYLHKVLKQIPQHNLEQLNIPVWVSTTSIDQGYNILYHEGEIIPIVSGSSAIPGLFDPVPYGNHLLIDGGISNNFPLKPLMECDLKIGVDVNYYDTPTHKIGTRDILSRAMSISINQASSHYRQHCDIFIYPPKLQQYNILDFDKADAIITIGYEETCAQLSSFLT